MIRHRSRNPSRAFPRVWPVLAVLALGLLAPTTASAQTCEAPPGISGIEQYCESIQGPGGKSGPSDRGGRGNGVGGGTARELRGSGSDGRAVLGLAGGGSGSDSGSGGAGSGGGEGGSGASGSKGSGGGSGDGGSKSGAGTEGSNSTGETGSSEGDTDESDDGLLSTLSTALSNIASGTGLILILLALAVLLTGIAWVRSRRGGQAEETPGEQ